MRQPWPAPFLSLNSSATVQTLDRRILLQKKKKKNKSDKIKSIFIWEAEVNYQQGIGPGAYTISAVV